MIAPPIHDIADLHAAAALYQRMRATHLAALRYMTPMVGLEMAERCCIGMARESMYMAVTINAAVAAWGQP